MPHVYALRAGLMCMPHVYALCVCLMCMPYVHALCACLMCMPYVYALCVCLVTAHRDGYEDVLCVCLTCMPYAYALYVCLLSACLMSTHREGHQHRAEASQLRAAAQDILPQAGAIRSHRLPGTSFAR